VDGIFWLIAGLAILSILFLYFVVPDPEVRIHHRDAQVTVGDLGVVLRDPELLRLDFGIFALHLVLTALFFAVPLLLQDHLPQAAQWKLYGPVIVASLVLMVPAIILGEVKHRLRELFIAAIAVASAGIAVIGMGGGHLTLLALGLLLFFVGFNVLEASLPSLVSKTARAGLRGTSIGVYNMAEFAGAGLGGALAGLLYGWGMGAVFAALLLVMAAWLLVALRMPPISYAKSLMVPVAGVRTEREARELQAALAAVVGVKEVVVYPGETTIFLKYDKNGDARQQIDAVLATAGVVVDD
jgi:MFS family permease